MRLLRTDQIPDWAWVEASVSHESPASHLRNCASCRDAGRRSREAPLTCPLGCALLIRMYGPEVVANLRMRDDP